MLTTYEEIISKYKKLYKYLQYHVLFILYMQRYDRVIYKNILIT